MEIEQVKSYLLQLQDTICGELADEDGEVGFLTDECCVDASATAGRQEPATAC